MSEDKRRGCLVMGKGLCDKDKTVLGQITSIGDKFTSILNKAKKSVSQMFSDSSIAPGISDAHKSVRISLRKVTDRRLFS